MTAIKKTILMLSSILTFTIASDALADLVETPACLGGNSLVCVTETEVKPGVVQYSITNNSNERIYGFGVTNNTAGNVAQGYQQYWVDNNQDYRPWIGTQFSASAWAEESFPFYSVLANGEANRDVVWSNLGSFAILFGTEDTYVNFYWNVITAHPAGEVKALNPGVTLNEFYLIGGFPESEFVAFGASGNVIASSLNSSVAAVPEPESYAMMLAGLGLMGFVARRNKADHKV